MGEKIKINGRWHDVDIIDGERLIRMDSKSNTCHKCALVDDRYCSVDCSSNGKYFYYVKESDFLKSIDKKIIDAKIEIRAIMYTFCASLLFNWYSPLAWVFLLITTLWFSLCEFAEKFYNEFKAGAKFLFTNCNYYKEFKNYIK